jgi:hypothetical protein
VWWLKQGYQDEYFAKFWSKEDFLNVTSECVPLVAMRLNSNQSFSFAENCGTICNSRIILDKGKISNGEMLAAAPEAIHQMVIMGCYQV